MTCKHQWEPSNDPAKPIYFCILCKLQDDHPEGEPWDEWFAKAKSLKPGIAGVSGWGSCYAAGLTPEEAVACCDKGTRREEVIAYCLMEPSVYDLKFE